MKTWIFRTIFEFILFVLVVIFAYYHFFATTIEKQVIHDTVAGVIAKPEVITQTLTKWKELSPTQSTKEVTNALSNQPKNLASQEDKSNADKIISIVPPNTSATAQNKPVDVYVNLDRKNMILGGVGSNSQAIIYTRDVKKIGNTILVVGVEGIHSYRNYDVLILGGFKF